MLYLNYENGKTPLLDIQYKREPFKHCTFISINEVTYGDYMYILNLW